MNTLRNTIIYFYYKFRYLILYGIIGGISAGFDFVVFYLLTTHLNVFYIAANVISVSLGITISFNLNRSFNFKVKDQYYLRYIIFFLVGFSGLVISSLLLYYFINVAGFGQLLSKLLSIVFVVMIQFLINRFVTFKKHLL
jgi:putative flippase GtrA